MTTERKYSVTLKVRIEPHLLEKVKEKAGSLDTDISTYVRWCIQTGLFLGDLSTFIRGKTERDK